MESSSVLFDLATAYYACRDADSLLKTFSTRIGGQLGARAALVWVWNDEAEGFTCRSRWSEPGERFEPVSEPVDEGVLAEVRESGKPTRLTGREVDPEALIHLEELHRGRVKAALYVPFPGARGVLAVAEVLNPKRGDFSADEITFATEAGRITGLALENRLAGEQDRHEQLATVERLTALYDIARIFNSTLELADLLPVVADKIRDILRASACNVWLADAESNELTLGQQSGEDPSSPEDARHPLDSGPLGEVAHQARSRLVENPAEEEALAERMKAAEGFEMTSWMAAPLLKDEEVLGIVEVINKEDGTLFTEEDLFFLGSISEQAAIALHNANLLESERKVHVLDALLNISKEITSTLDLNHVLTTVVAQAGTLINFDRCAIGYFDRGRFVLGAVSGETEVPKTREMDRLRDVLAWIAEQEDAVRADHTEEGWQTEPAQGAEITVRYMEEFGGAGFYGMPLRDEQGTVGVLVLLSNEAEFLTENQRETLAILANQTTVAIRNAQLYQQVPLVSLLKPFVKRKEKLVSIGGGKWAEIGLRVLGVAIVLTVVPWKMRVESNATVVPAERREVSAQTSGVIEKVFVHEGDRVEAGQVLARLDDSDNLVQLARAQASLGIARRDLADASDRGDSGAESQARLRADMFQAEANLYQQKVEQATLRAPISGVVVTPKVEEKAGKLLNAGDSFCELVDQDQMAAELNVPENDIGLLAAGVPVSIKLNAFPATSFTGQVKQLGAQTITAEGEQLFVVRVLFENIGLKARDGMAGKGKITAAGGWFHSGWYPVGYVMLRSPFRWLWRKAWDWMP